jgi:hypothetical protein
MPVAETVILTYVVIEGFIQWSINIHYLINNWSSTCYLFCCSKHKQDTQDTPKEKVIKPLLLRQSTPRYESPVRFRLTKPKD